MHEYCTLRRIIKNQEATIVIPFEWEIQSKKYRKFWVGEELKIIFKFEEF